MQASQIPPKFNIPFANSAGASYIRLIPLASQINILAGAASLTDGFPPVCFLPVGSGGTPPWGSDFNGILNQITKWSQWEAAGGTPVYDSAFSTAIGGYPQGAILASTTPGNTWISTVDNNVANPDAGGAGWQASITMKTNAGNPNGVVAGRAATVSPPFPPDFCWDTTDEVLWTCVTTGTATTAVWLQVTYQQLSSNTTLYVRSTGSDTTGTGTLANPFLTIQHAYMYAQQYYNANGFAITIDVGAGTFGPVALNGVVTGANVIGISGAGTASTTITGNASKDAIICVNGAAVSVNNCTLQSGGPHYCLNAQVGATISFGTSIVFAASSTGGHMYAQGGSSINAPASYTISGGAATHYSAQFGGLINAPNGVVTITGTPAFSTAFGLAIMGGVLNVNGNTYSGSATGSRYSVTGNGVINTGGAGVNYLPGNAAGTSSSGGQYI